MSYTIVYQRLFLRAGDRYIPLCLYGDNNVYYMTWRGRWRRDRNWGLFNDNDDMILSDADTLMAEVRRVHAGSTPDVLQYRGKWLNDAACVRFFEQGIKTAMSLEEIDWQTRGHASVNAYIYAYRPGQAHGERVMSAYISNTEGLVAWITRAKQEKRERVAAGTWSNAYLNIGFECDEPLDVKPIVKREGPVIAKGYRGQYVMEVAEGGYRCIKDRSKALVFANSDEAYRLLPKGWAFEIVRL